VATPPPVNPKSWSFALPNLTLNFLAFQSTLKNAIAKDHNSQRGALAANTRLVAEMQ
jgi:hypothetical protein